MARCLLKCKGIRTIIKKSILLPTLLSPKAFLKFFKQAFFLLYRIIPPRIPGLPSKASAY